MTRTSRNHCRAIPERCCRSRSAEMNAGNPPKKAKTTTKRKKKEDKVMGSRVQYLFVRSTRVSLRCTWLPSATRTRRMLPQAAAACTQSRRSASSATLSNLVASTISTNRFGLYFDSAFCNTNFTSTDCKPIRSISWSFNVLLAF